MKSGKYGATKAIGCEPKSHKRTEGAVQETIGGQQGEPWQPGLAAS